MVRNLLTGLQNIWQQSERLRVHQSRRVTWSHNSQFWLEKSQNYEIWTQNSDFFPHNSEFTSCNSDFYPQNSEFTSFISVFFCHGIKNKKVNCDFLYHNFGLFLQLWVYRSQFGLFFSELQDTNSVFWPFSQNCEFLSLNSDIFPQNCEFIPQKKVRIVRYKYLLFRGNEMMPILFHSIWKGISFYQKTVMP